MSRVLLRQAAYLARPVPRSWGSGRTSWRWRRLPRCTAAARTCSHTEDHRPAETGNTHTYKQTESLEKVKPSRCDWLAFHQHEVMGERRFRATEYRNQEERTTQTEDYTETIKNHHRYFSREKKRRGKQRNWGCEEALKWPTITGKLNNIY